LVRAKRSQAFDLAMTMKFQARRSPWLSRVMAVVSWPGFPPQSHFIPPVITATLWGLGYRLEAVFQLLAWGTGGVSTVLKGIMMRPRPLAPEVQVVLAPLGGSSFPSGHVITYMGTYGWLAYCVHTLIRPAGIRRALLTPLLAMLALVGPSRIYQGHHWATDVTASYMLGTSYLIVLTGLYRGLKRKTGGG
jgi:undecaprenyl-diphosphatase